MAAGDNAGGRASLADRVFGPDRPPGPIVRLPTWVNIVLLLTLLASCGGANASRSYDSQSVPSQNYDSNAATKDDVRDLCRLLGAVAEKQGIDTNDLLQGSTSGTACVEGIQQR